MTLTERIRQDWGTGTHFCRKHGLNYGSFALVIGGHRKSQKCVDALIAHGYIKKASDLPQYQNGQAA